MSVFSEGLHKYGPSLRVNTINLVFVSGGFGVTRLLALAASVLLARLAGAEVFGEFTLFMAVFVIASTIGENLDTTFMRFASAPGAEGEETRHHAVHVSAKVLYAVAVSLVGWLLAPVVADLAFHKPESAPLIRLAAAGGGLVSIFNAIIGFYRRRQRFLVVAALLPALNLTVLIVLGGLVVAGTALDAAIVAQVYVFAATPLALVAVVRLLAMRPVIGKEIRSRLVGFYRVAAPLMGASAVGLVANRLDIFFLASYAAFADLGQYGASLRIAAVLAILSGAFRTILVPKAAAAIHDRTRLRRYLAVSGFYSSLFTVAATALVVFIEPVVSLLFGEQYQRAAAIAVVLIVKIGLETYTTPFQAMIQCGPRPGDMLYLSVGRLAVTALLLTVLLPPFGIIGGAYAVAATAAILLVATCTTALVNAWPEGRVKAGEGV